MPPTITERKEFTPGTTGWTADDLNDPELERQWNKGRYEIVEGVLTTMPPAYFDGGLAMQNLIRHVERHLDKTAIGGRFGPEADFIVSPRRVAVVDAVYMTDEDLRKQREANAARGRRSVKYGRLLVPPTLALESLSLGHEAHDAETKRQWYEEFGVPNYWLLDAYAKSLECLVLENGRYRTDQKGSESELLRPSLFPGLVIPLAEVWG